MLAGYESDGFQMDFWPENVFIPMVQAMEANKEEIYLNLLLNFKLNQLNGQ